MYHNGSDSSVIDYHFKIVQMYAAARHFAGCRFDTIAASTHA